MKLCQVKEFSGSNNRFFVFYTIRFSLTLRLLFPLCNNKTLYIFFFIEANRKFNTYYCRSNSTLLYFLHKFLGALGVFSQVTVTIYPKSGHQVAWQPCSGLIKANYLAIFFASPLKSIWQAWYWWWEISWENAWNYSRSALLKIFNFEG